MCPALLLLHRILSERDKAIQGYAVLFPFILFSYNRRRLHSITSERFRLVRSSPYLSQLDLSDVIHPVWSPHHLLLILSQ